MTNARNMLLGLCILGVCPSAALGDVQLTVTSYSMFNGGTGSFDYRDTSYLPCPGNVCDTTGAFLSGGTGKLTDGILPTRDWDLGPPEGWVGWSVSETNGTNPLVTFNFNQSVTIHSVEVWFDNTVGSGGVGAPNSISVDGTNHTGIPQGTFGPQGFTISGLSLTGTSANVQFFQGSDPWIMIGEVTFNGTTAAPEPSTFIPILVVGFGYALKRLSRRVPAR